MMIDETTDNYHSKNARQMRSSINWVGGRYSGETLAVEPPGKSSCRAPLSLKTIFWPPASMAPLWHCGHRAPGASVDKLRHWYRLSEVWHWYWTDIFSTPKPSLVIIITQLNNAHIHKLNLDIITQPTYARYRTHCFVLSDAHLATLTSLTCTLT
jgi:hypothetical protein